MFQKKHLKNKELGRLKKMKAEWEKRIKEGKMIIEAKTFKASEYLRQGDLVSFCWFRFFWRRIRLSNKIRVAKADDVSILGVCSSDCKKNSLAVIFVFIGEVYDMIGN